jgi:hypothetical protein
MLGILIALMTVTGVAALTMIRRDLPLLALIAIFIWGAEMGEGFTSFQGSIFFNQNFLDLANLKLVEVILYSYTGLLILLEIPSRRKFASSALRRLYWLWLVWLAVLLYVQYDARGFIDPSAFRGIYFGWALLYVLVSVIDCRVVMRRAIISTVVLLTVKALWLMLMFAIGQGDQTPRGDSPVFWDDKLLEAFTWVLLIFLVSVVQPQNEKDRWPTTLVFASMALIAVLIALSLRRNYLGQVAVGAVFLLLYIGRHIHMQRFLSFTLVGAVLFGIVFIAGLSLRGSVPLVQQLIEYAQLLNFTSPTDFWSMDENAVRVTNLQSYTALLSEYEDIRLFGRSAAPTDDYRTFNRQYSASLGLAHNGPLRAIFDFGIGGLVVWAGFFYVIFRAALHCRLEQLESWERAVVIGTTAALFSQFIFSLTVLPPFFTTNKILFFFLYMAYVIEFYSRESRVPEAQPAGVTPLLRPAESYASA